MKRISLDRSAIYIDQYKATSRDGWDWWYTYNFTKWATDCRAPKYFERL